MSSFSLGHIKIHTVATKSSKTWKSAGAQLHSCSWPSHSLQASSRGIQLGHTSWSWLPASSWHCPWACPSSSPASCCVQPAGGVTHTAQTQQTRPFEADCKCQCRNTRRVFGRKARRCVCGTLYLQSCRCVCWNLPGWQVRVFHHHCQQGISELLYEPFSL